MSDLVAIESEIAQIQELMRMDRAAYNRDEITQARYRQLLVVQQSGQVQSEPDSHGDALVEMYSQKQFQAEHGTLAGFDEYVRRVRRAADVVQSVPPSERWEFKESIENWPDELADAAFEEMMRRPFNAGYSDTDEMAQFAAMPEGRIAIREWGSDAAINHAIVKARLIRVMESVSVRQAEIFWNWHDHLSPEGKMAVYRVLVR
jgi:hypothetical protein